jgi:hypothetical protein
MKWHLSTFYAAFLPLLPVSFCAWSVGCSLIQNERPKLTIVIVFGDPICGAIHGLHEFLLFNVHTDFATCISAHHCVLILLDKNYAALDYGHTNKMGAIPSVATVNFVYPDPPS